MVNFIQYSVDSYSCDIIPDIVYVFSCLNMVRCIFQYLCIYENSSIGYFSSRSTSSEICLSNSRQGCMKFLCPIHCNKLCFCPK